MEIIASDMNSTLARMLDSYEHPAILVNPEYQILATNDLTRPERTARWPRRPSPASASGYCTSTRPPAARNT
jgi:hypothetical protein